MLEYGGVSNPCHSLGGKRLGLTYKDIRKKLGTQVAESTLRGRYRSLTKKKEDRRRKPEWQLVDVSAPIVLPQSQTLKRLVRFSSSAMLSRQNSIALTQTGAVEVKRIV